MFCFLAGGSVFVLLLGLRWCVFYFLGGGGLCLFCFLA